MILPWETALIYRLSGEKVSVTKPMPASGNEGQCSFVHPAAFSKSDSEEMGFRKIPNILGLRRVITFGVGCSTLERLIRESASPSAFRPPPP